MVGIYGACFKIAFEYRQTVSILADDLESIIVVWKAPPGIE